MKDRKTLNEMLTAEKRNIDEENFDEAIAASFRACRKTEIPPEIKRILLDPKTQHLTPEVTTFLGASLTIVYLILDPGEMHGRFRR
jgi:hypothetical protein